MPTGHSQTTLTLARGNVQLDFSNPPSTFSASDKIELERQTAALYYVLRGLTGENLNPQEEWQLYHQALRSVVATSFPELKPLRIVWTSGASVEWSLRDRTTYQPASITPHPPRIESFNSAQPSPTSPPSAET